MKNIKIFFSLIFICSISLSSIAQIEEGKVTYKMEMPDLDPSMASMFGDTKLTMLFNDENVKMDMNMGMMQTNTFIDIESGETVVLMDLMGQKMKIVMGQEDMKAEQMDEKDYEIVKTGEMEKIADYECEKLIIKTKDMDMTVFVSYDIKSFGSLNNQFTKLEGFPMKYESVQSGMKLSIEATSVEVMKISDDEFVIPDGYKEMSMDELEMMGR